MRFRSTIVLLGITCLFPAALALADDPAYMNLEVGTAIEVSGQWAEDDHAFVAQEIELLPAPRRPKLRGEIQATDSLSQRIQVFGQWITVTEKTEFLNVEDIQLDFSVLKRGGRVETSCKVDSAGHWVARHIRVRGVKKSDKIKGTITSTDFDGTPPDILEIEGLRILVDEKTVLFKTLGPGPSDTNGGVAAEDEASADSGQ